MIAFVQGFEREVIPVSEVHKLLTKSHGILDNALSELVMQLVTWHIFNSGGIIKESGLESFPFFAILRTHFLLVRLGFMVALIGFWFRLSNDLPLDCPRHQPLYT